MTKTQIKDYLKKYRINSEEQLAKHIEELKRNTIPNNEIIFPLVDLLLNEKAVLLSFFAENKKQELFTRTITPFFLDEVVGKCSTQCFCDGSCKKTQEKKLGGYNKPNVYINSTRHKSKSGETHKEIVGDLEGINRPPSMYDKDLVFVKEGTGFDYLKIMIKDDVITSSSRGEKETMEALDNLRNTLNKSPIEIIKEVQEEKQGIKETNGKTDYSEINLEILDLMAERFTANKHKYPKGNMKKPIDIKSLEWALFRHVKKMIQPIETDEETYKDHLSAVLCNASMILDQLKVK